MEGGINSAGGEDDVLPNGDNTLYNSVLVWGGQLVLLDEDGLDLGLMEHLGDLPDVE